MSLLRSGCSRRHDFIHQGNRSPGSVFTEVRLTHPHHMIHDRKVEVAEWSLAKHNVLILSEANIAPADQSRGQFIAAVIAPVHAATKEYHRIVEHTGSIRICNCIEL